MNIKKMTRLAVASVGCAAAFSLTTISFHTDISLAAFPLALVFVALLAFVVFGLFRRDRTNLIPAYRELLQYLPYVLLIAFVLRRAGQFGTPSVLDACSVLFWLASSVLSLIVLYYLNPKRVEQYFAYTVPPKTKKAGAKWLALEALSWIDALVQAVFMVLLLNIFIVQLYEIPSESMVPEFLIKDRVVVFKTLSGPKFPLSNIGLPYVKSYKRGDIVVFRNPHYANDRKSEVKTFVSQLVYMISLTKVNLNMDEDGRPKADPLVKRLVGVPGEQLMMQDGVLYHRTAASDAFTVVEDDATWAEWNLNAVKPSLKKSVVDFPLEQDDYDMMLACEEQRNALVLSDAAIECKALSNRFASLSARFAHGEKTGAFSLGKNDLMVYTYVLFGSEYRLVPYLLADANVTALTHRLLQATNGAEWFSDFMTAWIVNNPDAAKTPAYFFGDDLYTEASFKLNLMIKLTLGRMIVRNLELLTSNVPPSLWSSDTKRLEYLSQGQMLTLYTCLQDRRNMPLFPPNDADGNAQYIPEHCYFMMGDNRFNSQDMRHSYENWLAPLSPYDDYSATYYTNMQPQYVHRNRILGTTSYRFWPFLRRGIPGHTGK